MYQKTEILPGISHVSTPDHDYLVLSEQRMAEMREKAPALLRPTRFYRGGNWFETDVEGARVILAFRDEFSPEQVEKAICTLRDYHPEIYETFQGSAS